MKEAFRYCANPGRHTPATHTAAADAVANLAGWRAAVDEITNWPEYREEPLRSLPRMAARMGIRELFYKDESQRFGPALGSFKALGAPFAVAMLLADEVERVTGRRPPTRELREGIHGEITSRVTVCVATDGNQGRGLAYGAKVFGCRCVTYIHHHVSAERKAAMERLGAIVIRVDGEYDLSVARAREDARMNGWHFVSSTSWDNYQSALPRHVMAGYRVMIEEAAAQTPDLAEITHVIVHSGVGSIAAAVFLGLQDHLGEARPRFVVVEPVEADCTYQTARAGQLSPSGGTLRTIMAGLACRSVSPAAWLILSWLASDFVCIPDEWAREGMRALARGEDGPIIAGESAAGGIGMLLQAQSHTGLRESLGLTENSRVLYFGCEGATDPTIYEQIVGLAPRQVERMAREKETTLG